MTLVIQHLNEAHQSFIWIALYHAIYVAPDGQPPPEDIVTRPELRIYAQNFGQQPGDVGMIAFQDDLPVGAAWVRLIQSYGFVDADTPELTLAVLPDYRGKGIGTLLLEHLFREVESKFTQMSLSVTWTNPARHLYERTGFVTVRLENGTAVMVKAL